MTIFRFCVFSFFCFLLAGCQASSVQTAVPLHPENDYPVKVTVDEASNRTLIATVRDHRLVIDQPRAFKGDDNGPTPPELLAVSYGTCVASTLQLVALQRGITIDDISVTVEGTVNFSKALGVSDDMRAGFSSLTATVSFVSRLNEAEKRALINEVARVGAVLDNLKNPTPLKYIVKPAVR